MCISISSKDCFNMQDWGVFCLPQNMHYAGNVQVLLTQNFDKCVISFLQKIIQMIKWVLSFTNIWKLELSLFIKDLNYPRNLIPFFNVRLLLGGKGTKVGVRDKLHVLLPTGGTTHSCHFVRR